MTRTLAFLFCVSLLILSTPTRAAGNDIHLLFGGDVTLTGAYEDIAPNLYDTTWPFKRLRKLFKSADVVMVNCESAITKRGVRVPKQFNFRMKPFLTSAFLKGGVSIVNLANNHVYDYGAVGLRDTIRNLNKAGIAHVGAGMNLAEARRPVIRNIKGKRIAFLGYGNYSPATATSPGVAYRYQEQVIEDIQLAKQRGADIVIVYMHWGIERALSPTKDDRALAYQAIDAGADAIVGSHPHVLQPTEQYHGKVIAWSLGNFIFGGNKNQGKDSALLEVIITPDGTLSHKLIPIRIDAQETHYQPYVIE